MKENHNSICYQLIDAIYKSKKPLSEISKKTGISESAIRSWLVYGKIPSLKNAAEVLNAIGYDFVIVNKGM